MHTLTPERLRQLLASPEALRLSVDARQRLQWIADFIVSGESITTTCARLGIARSTFHRWLERFDPNDLSTLEERAHDAETPRTSAVPDTAVALIRTYREESPLVGKERIRELLLRDHSIELSASTIGRIIERECLYFGATPLHWRKRMEHQRRATQEHAAQIGHESSGQTPAYATTISAAQALHTTGQCECAWCKLWSIDWRWMRRTVGTASLLINIALISLYMATVYWEQQTHALRADLTQHTIETRFNLDSDSLPDGQ